MKPFNLEKALAGAPVVTRDGRRVEQLHSFKVQAPSHPLYGVVDGCLYSWHNNDGQAYSSSLISGSDLFMAPIKRIKFANIYRNTIEGETYLNKIHGYLYPSREDADKNAGVGRVACVEIEIEE